MKYSEAELPEVKLECLRSLARLNLKAEQHRVVQRFIDAYTPLTPLQQKYFDKQLSNVAPSLREVIMTYITSWERKGMEIGRAEGLAEGRAEGRAEARAEARAELAQQVARKLVSRRFVDLDHGLIDAVLELPLEKLELLPERIFDFTSIDDLRAWVDE